MKCPFCQEPDSRVLDSRTSDDGAVIRRRRECLVCKRRFTTYERMEERPLIIVKREGNREAFNRDKLSKGVLKAVEKRPVSMEMVDAMVADIERELRDTYDREVTSQAVGEKVMEKLRILDEVAYVRFASVYRQFADVESFIKAVKQLKKNNNPRGED
ncbi:MAG: transcriptional regulator NrdR [Ignavibacteriales bacterium]